MNFNFSNKPEYSLNSSLSKEMINLYGVIVKLLIVQRINQDLSVFGDFTHLKSDSKKIFDLPVLPENTEDWDDGGFQMSAFGPLNFENISLFIHVDYLKDLDIPLNKITGNLLVFPNNKIMEISHTEITVPGLNNLFTQTDTKTLIKVTCKPYNQKIISELDASDRMYSVETEDITEDPNFESLEKYFDELMDREDDLRQETEVLPSVGTVKPGPVEDEIIKKPVVDNSIDDAWGRF